MRYISMRTGDTARLVRSESRAGSGPGRETYLISGVTSTSNLKSSSRSQSLTRPRCPARWLHCAPRYATSSTSVSGGSIRHMDHDDEALCAACGTSPGQIVLIAGAQHILCSRCVAKRIASRAPLWRLISAVIAIGGLAAGLILMAAAVHDLVTAGPGGPANRTLREMFELGWTEVGGTSAGDRVDLLAAIVGIALTVAVSLTATVSAGEKERERQDSASVPDLDAHVRLITLDKIVALESAVILLSAAAIALFTIDTVQDRDPGWPFIAFFASVGGGWLLRSFIHLSAFGSFAEHSRLLVGSERAVQGSCRIDKATAGGWRGGLSALAIFFGAHVAVMAIMAPPAEPRWILLSLVVLLSALISPIATLAFAIGNLRSNFWVQFGLAATTGLVFGGAIGTAAARASLFSTMGVADAVQTLAGISIIVTLHLLVAIGFLGTGWFRGLVIFTVKAEEVAGRVTKGVTGAVRRRSATKASRRKHGPVIEDFSDTTVTDSNRPAVLEEAGTN